MTLDELLAREGIRQTLATYNMAGDRVRLDEFLTVFTEDAVLESAAGGSGGAWRCEGLEEIRRFMSGLGGGARRPAGIEPPKFVRHNITTCQIELTGPETAQARTYFHVYTQVGPDHAGVYTDELRKVGERWLIRHRRVRTEWWARESLFRAAE